MRDQETSDDGFINTKAAAKLIGLSPATLMSWRSRKADGPPCYPISGNTVLYKRAELLAWVEQYRRESGVQLTPVKPGAQPRPWES